MPKILLATEKPFAAVAVSGIKQILDEAGFETVLLEKYTDKADLLKAVADADGMIIRSDKASADVIAAAQNLKIVVRAGAGYDNIDLPACNEKKIVAMNTPGQNSNAVAELAMGMMIYAARNFFNPGTGSELAGKKIGLFAFGNVGRKVAKLAKGLGMIVYVYAPTKEKTWLEGFGTIVVSSPEELFSTCNYISLHIPANEKTKKTINYDLMSKLPKGAVIVNTARKEIVCEDSLKKVFEERADVKYVTDIACDCHTEMMEKYASRYFATPKKMGAETAEANINAGLAAAKQIVDFLQNGNTQFQVNKF